MRRRKSSVQTPERRSKERGKIRRLPPSADAARDEGPRLLPLGDRISEPSRLEHYLDLADAALGVKPRQLSSGDGPEQKKSTGA